MKKVLKNKKAFTLTEMIVVIAIIGILAGVLIPTITGYIKRANQSAAYQEAEAVLNVYETWVVEKESGLQLENNSFIDYYEEITGETASLANAYIDSEMNPTNFYFITDKVHVTILLSDGSVYYDKIDNTFNFVRLDSAALDLQADA